RTSNLLTQIRKIETESRFDFENVRSGLLLMFWGLFQKLVIADRAALLVNTVYDNYTAYGFLSITAASIAFAFQVYCDFDGYTNIARGAARVLGIRLIKNFRQPYLASNIQDFWRRWHVSLTSWFTDYLYIPLGGSRRGTKRQLLNVLIVFTVSGLWHGASWNFVAWGFLHAIYQCAGILRRKYSKDKTTTSSFMQGLWKRLITFVLVDIAWIFFRANDMAMARGIFVQMLTHPGVSSLFHMGPNTVNMIVLLAGLIVLLIVDVMHENNISVFEFVYKKPVCFRWILYLLLIWSCIMFGIYGISYTSSQFIYFQF
ncbi:MAG: MBOAT family protein, partial [Thermoflexaceae bacterium]|nr:MBOAT family protein [Thermoflexaceae bacterium]